MVNRGGRSKACRTCKRRRVKCDHGKPNCQRCEKAGVACEGYVTYGEFVDETTRFAKDKSPVKNSQLQVQPASPSAKATERQIWRPPPLLLDQDAVIHAHLLSRIDEVTPLMANLESITLSDSTRSLAVRALAAVYFGKTNSDKRIFDLGSREYVKALNRVQLDLASSTAVLEWDTLASVICLCMFENIVFTDKTGWLKHYEGITQLVSSVITLRLESILNRRHEGQAERAMETPNSPGKGTPQTVPILCALINRKHCYLTLPEWQTVPWPSTVPKTASDALHDIFARVPGQLHDMDRVQRGEVDNEFFEELRQRVETTLSDLEDWEQFCQHPRPLTGSPLTSTQDSTSHPVRHKALLALQRAIILCMTGLCTFFNIPLVAEIPSILEDRKLVRKAIATEICQLAASCLGHESHSTESLLFIFPLQIASMNFETGSAEEKGAEEIMNGVIAGTHGFEIGRRREWKASSVILIK
ncbi:Zn(2)-C6 fungal-type DNA-binding domain [Fusarium oxysporum f. sp. vasinfectum]|nr:Zn(2)-C6 fungal-type DNA-binding domain [Fusarium oxysporum f. sp. vasinfectum]